MKCSSKMLQKLPYFWNTKTCVCYVGPKIWKILKHFSRQLHQAQTSNFGRVTYYTWKKLFGGWYSKTKHFAWQFHQAQTSYFWRVTSKIKKYPQKIYEINSFFKNIMTHVFGLHILNYIYGNITCSNTNMA